MAKSNKYFLKFANNIEKLAKKYPQILYVLIFSLAGLLLLSLTRAVSSFVAVEIESASLSNGASIASDASVSGGQYVLFDGSTNSANGLYNSIGHVGCSNTRDHVEGYHDISNADRFWGPPAMDTGGGSIDRWYNNSANHWGAFDARYASEGGADAIWFQICIKAGGTDPGGMTVNQQDMITFIINEINSRTGGSVPIYISPLNIYEEENCDGVGPYGVSNSIELADWAAAQGLALRGPNTGPLSPSLLQADQCHPNDAGHIFVGQQMVDFLD